jgi:hypothetical protein
LDLVKNKIKEKKPDFEEKHPNLRKYLVNKGNIKLKSKEAWAKVISKIR